MNGIEKITEKILSDAGQYRAQTTDSARKEAEEILSRAQTEADAILTAGNVRAKERAESVLSRAESSADKAGKNILLACRAALLDEAFAAAKKDICALPRQEYSSLLVSLVKSAVSGQLLDAKILAESDDEYVEPESFVISLNAPDREAFGEELAAAALEAGAKKASLGENIQASGGVIVTWGDIISNCLTDNLTDGARDRLEPGVADILFKGKSK